MKKLSTFFLFALLLQLVQPGSAVGQKCRYDADMTNPTTHARSRRVHVDLDKRWAILFQQEDTVYSVCLLMNVTDSTPEKIVKGNMLHVELEDGKLFDLFASEDGKATTKEVASGECAGAPGKIYC